MFQRRSLTLAKRLPGSVCSVHFGKNVTSAAPGSAKAFLIVTDIEAARDHLVAAGVEVGEFARFGARRPLTACTRSALGSATRTGQTGTPPTWWLSSLAKSCRNDRTRTHSKTALNPTTVCRYTIHP